MKISIIPPFEARDVLGDTVIEGFLKICQNDESYSLAFPNWYKYPTDLDIKKHLLDEQTFLNFSKNSDIIVLIEGKRGTNISLANEIDCWKKTVYIDGSELGKNRRYDQSIQFEVLAGTFNGYGRIKDDILNKCALYFRREKPYIKGIIPLSFGIDSRYIKYSKDIIKDIDITCIFGQNDYPPMRKYATDFVKEFCKINNLVCETEITKDFGFDDSKNKGRNQFYDILARTKIGISISGGGFDTCRFWEILANNCILLTENIDIQYSDYELFNKKRIIQFNNLYDLQNELEKLVPIIKNGKYKDMLDDAEYNNILKEHSAEARSKFIIDKFNERK